ncbi:hypothetical protein CVU75_00975 [Candidatus Dependentiae bacterium HGW-Dependentiae-1]|nr:MAG: hypothetical protein CVU75_00975 [Candidatus Dependentiae bacterium HGW-Dependentiae-1]
MKSFTLVMKIVLAGCLVVGGALLFKRLSSDPLTQVKCHFDDVLLIINYTHPHYQTIDFLKKIYGKSFSHIVFYGEKPDPRVHTVTHHEGWYGYRSLADALQRYPNFRGYLYTNDDCFLNFWNLVRLDKSKIWLDKPTAHVVLDPTALAPSYWCWWAKECGYKAAQKVYDLLAEKYKKQLQHNCGDSSICYGFSDLVYIPQEYKQEMHALCALCSEQKLFLEIALPMMNASLAPREEWELFNSLVLWGSDRCSRSIQDYTLAHDVIHPLKFSDKKVQAFIEQRVEQAVVALSEFKK